MKYLLTALVWLLFLRCNEPGNDAAISSDTISTNSSGHSATKSSAQSNCYRKITGRDTLILQLKSEGNEVEGTMVFDNYEKDSSHGLVTGTTQNGLIVVWYNFYAEGMQSVVQHAFKPVGDDLVLGTGALEYRNDSAFIKDLNEFNFRPENLLKQVDCSAIDMQVTSFKP